ncbi:unnamed protein product [Acanthoscelides obtectus]|uniref:C2H2-type domain-containing protein n=1 Tax=Acanthoscelides obtectus TaxID=200917 RepID=A0A9P0PA02_ACAOB|nr:unnamed protein product [Acanthoscelides obtectus]CAK1664816.1 Zinc finger protein 142 [Acanthoscelides obtectus]
MSAQKEKMASENYMYGKVVHGHIKSEKGEVPENIKVENYFDREESGVTQISHVFVDNEYGQRIDPGFDMDVANTVSDRISNSCEINSDHTFMRFEGTCERVLGMPDEGIQLEKDVDNNKHPVTESSDQLAIKSEDYEQNENTGIILNSLCYFITATQHGFTKPWIKREAVELKLEYGVACEITEITEECLIKNEDDILKHTKRSLEDGFIGNCPGFTDEVSSNVFACAHCTYEASIKENLVQHMLKHSGSEETCIHCKVTFKNKIHLDDHVIKKHPGYILSVSSKVHECVYCMYKTTLKDNFAKHMLNHPDFVDQVSSKSKYCMFKTISKWNINRHMGKHSRIKGRGVLKKCVHCDESFRRKTTLTNHIIKKHPEYIASIPGKIHECKYCEFKSAVKGHLDSHMIAQHPEAEVGFERKPRLNPCVHCDAMFICKKSIDDHIIKKHPEYTASVSRKIYECEYCAYKTTFSVSFARHMGTHPGAKGGLEHKSCIHCNTTFSTKASLDDHIIKKHPEYIASVSNKIHKCKQCAFKTTRKTHFAKHIKCHGGRKLKICAHCNAKFKCDIYLDDHIMKKHPEHSTTVSSKIYECKYCEFKTALKNGLAAHMGKHPEAEDGCQLKTCTGCDAMFKNKISLDDHVIEKHPEYIAWVSSKIHECKYCVFKTAIKGNLVSHVMGLHPGVDVCESKPCIHCNATFRCQRSLDDHTIKRHPEYIASVLSKIHECKFCTFKTTLKGSLASHMGKHPEAVDCEPKKCVHCNATYTTKVNLDDHMIKKHPEYIATISTKIHKCKHCLFKTTKKSHLARHMKNHGAESESEPKTCVHCNVKFKRTEYLDDHIIKKHPEHTALVASEIHECKYCEFKTALKSHFISHMRKHSGVEAECKKSLDDHTINKHTEVSIL